MAHKELSKKHTPIPVTEIGEMRNAIREAQPEMREGETYRTFLPAGTVGYDSHNVPVSFTVESSIVVDMQYDKGKMWFVDAEGAWYAVSPSKVSIVPDSVPYGFVYGRLGIDTQYLVPGRPSEKKWYEDGRTGAYGDVHAERVEMAEETREPKKWEDELAR